MDSSNVFMVAKDLRAAGSSMAALARWIGISENSIHKWMERGVVPEARREAVALAVEAIKKRAAQRHEAVMTKAEADYEGNWRARLYATRVELLRELAEIDAALAAHGEG
jgi:lambda repressor-like predicted transcriptional regulator